MDLDGFKDVNDTLGHHVGDGLLQHVASELAVGFGTDGVVCRLGGDEFAVAVGQLETIEAAWALGRRIHAVVERPVAVDELEVDVRASVGMAIAPGHGDNVSELLRRADVAMYDAKREATGLEAYAADRDHYSARRLSLAADLRRAIDNGDLAVFYQPQLDLRRREVVGFEALVRWPHERHGFVPPDEFIPIAEQSGLIRPLTSLVLEQTILQAAAWREAGESFRVAVNISARSLFAAGLEQEVPALLGRVGLPPSLLTLEVTESSVMTELARAVGVLSSLAASGIRLSIDDFGTGHSSLAQLRDLPVDEIKIDKSFVLNLARDNHDAAIVRSILELARNVGLEVVAEGIEDAEALQLLHDYGCGVGQGYFIAKPLPPARVGEWLAEWRAKSAGPFIDERAPETTRTSGLRLVASE
jgi:diguanylate cyclase (GGDEF)-like protein